MDIRVPTLRERRADVLELANHFLDRHRTTRLLRLSTAAADALATYEWPGNVRELERLMERAVDFSGLPRGSNPRTSHYPWSGWRGQVRGATILLVS